MYLIVYPLILISMSFMDALSAIGTMVWFAFVVSVILMGIILILK